LFSGLLGEKDQAFKWLEEAYEEHAGGFYNIVVGQEWDSLRDDHHFHDLLRRMNLMP